MIAIVSDIEIVRSDIAVSSDEVEFRYKLKTGHPIEAGQESEIEGLREQQCCLSL